MGKEYKLGTSEQQEYLRSYNYVPKGYCFLEPGAVASDSNDYAAYNIAKSFYQVYPEVFNISYISKVTGLKEDDIKARIKKMYENREFMLVYNPCVSVSGFGLYYWVVKLKKDTTKEEREELTKWFQDNDQICTGYMMSEGGDFDYYNGNHMRNIDNLVGGVLDKFRFRRCVEYVHICPIRRLVRESHVNQFDSLKDYRRYFFNENAIDKLCKLQKKMDKDDFKIIDAINNTKTIKDMFDYDFLAKLSGLDTNDLRENLSRIVDKEKQMFPMVYFNYRALGLKMHFYLVSFFENTPTFRSEEIVDELANEDVFNNIFDFGDSHHNIMLSCYEDINDLDKVKAKLLSYGEVSEVLESTSPRQFRRWTCRLDDDNGYWEECVFTDDVLVDRSVNDTREDK